ISRSVRRKRAHGLSPRVPGRRRRQASFTPISSAASSGPKPSPMMTTLPAQARRARATRGKCGWKAKITSSRAGMWCISALPPDDILSVKLARMSATTDDSMAPDPATAKAAERRALGVACGAHALHDGYTDLVYVMLPIWQGEFGLGFAALGLMRTVFSGTLAGLQIPAGFAAERFGAATVLALGTALAGLGYIFAGLSSGVAGLGVALFIGGLGASTQHPLASSLIAHAFAGSRSLKALGTYNFAGDIGKMVFPAAAALMLIVLPWRQTLMILGALGAFAALAIFVAMPRFSDAQASS